MSAPVGHTCPMIDAVIETVNSVCVSIDRIDFNEPTVEELADSLQSIRTDLADIAGFTYRNPMEDIRSANSDLRDWGTKTEEDLSQAEERISELEEEVGSLEYQLGQERQNVEAMEKQIERDGGIIDGLFAEIADLKATLSMYLNK